ncbi:thiamine pyrophosphate-dependent enzyme [Streptomyces sp. NPDC001941]|uniref:thiamine pyrophosphate-dependent enzyme n=1 Tax=Streptomyces sp. NPDC001941 TaxID=3154659 RepID=UPI0033237431
MSSTAAGTLVSGLQAFGVDRVFCVPGESYLPVLDALLDTAIDVVTCRHEGSAAFMALADAELTKRAGVCLVSRAPGAANALIGVQAAHENATPLVLLVGDVSHQVADREAFQYFDASLMFGNVSKAVWQLSNPASVGELISRAFRLAESGTPGPVVLTLPQDILASTHPCQPPLRRITVAPPEPSQAQMSTVHSALRQAERPLLIAGSLLDRPQARVLTRFVAEHHHLPVLPANKHPHLMPSAHPYLGGRLHHAVPAAQRALYEQADLILAVGTRLGWVVTDAYTFPAAPGVQQRLVHVYPDASRIAARYQPDPGLAVDPVAFLAKLAELPAVQAPHSPWHKALRDLEADTATWRSATAPDGVLTGAVADAVNDLTGGDLTAVIDSGAFTGWLLRYLRFTERGRLLGLTSSSMGFAVGAGIAAELRAPSAMPTIVFAGDGGFLMNGSELATAAARNARVIFIVLNDNSYGSIRRRQELAFPGRPVATDLSNPDFVRLGQAFGLLGLSADRPVDVRPALKKALQHQGPALIEIRTSRSQPVPSP